MLHVVCVYCLLNMTSECLNVIGLFLVMSSSSLVNDGSLCNKYVCSVNEYHVMTLFECFTAGIPVHIVLQDNGSSSNVGDVSLCVRV